jgi:type I restriction enzyme S subunit
VSWPLVELGGVLKVVGGYAFKSKEFVEDGFPIIRISNIDGINVNLEKAAKVPEEIIKGKERFRVNSGDILIAMSGATTGKLGVVPERVSQVYLNQRVGKFDFDSIKLHNKFLYYFLLSDVCQTQINALAAGAAQPNISGGQIESIMIPLPPLTVQKQIAAALEKADTLRGQCQQMEQELNTLAQSVFLDMFGDPVTNPKGWGLHLFKYVCESQLGKMLSEKSKQGVNPKKYLRNANVRWRKIELHDLLEMDFNEKEMKKFTLNKGDLLICEGGDVGRCAIWEGELDDCYYQKALHRVRVNKKLITPEYMQEYFFWMSKLGGLASSVSEVTFSHLTAAKLSVLKVPTPPIDLQIKYSQKMKVMSEQLNQISSSFIYYDELFKSLIQRAFKGELKLKDVA